ncbi:MAG: hypothetical protein WD875_07485 [Pirellulales bacterium]
MSKYLQKYSVVVDGQGTPTGRPEDHERDIEATLATLAATATGRAVFRKIVAHGVVRIRPYLAGSVAKWGACNALAFSERHKEKVSSGISRTAVDVQYSLSTWSATSGCASGPGSLTQLPQLST